MKTQHYSYRQLQKTLKQARIKGYLEQTFKLNQKKIVLQAKLEEITNLSPNLIFTTVGVGVSHILPLKPTVKQPHSSNEAQPFYSKPNVYETIKKLDAETSSDNYLPIYYLREVFPNRKGLDATLYALQKEGLVNFSRLCNASKVTPEQYEAGIKQGIGGPIFYLIAA